MADIEKTAGPQPNVLWSESRGPASNIKKVNGSGGGQARQSAQLMRS